jgi:hypothetical protein
MAVDVAVRGDRAGLQMRHNRRTILGATVVPLLMSRAPPAQVNRRFLPAIPSDAASADVRWLRSSQALSSAANTAWEALGGGPADLYYPDEFVGAWYARSPGERWDRRL